MRSYRQTSSSKLKETKEKFILVREGLFYGLVIETGKSNKISIDRGVTSTPTFIFHTANTKCLIDFCSPTNQVAEISANEYFSQFAFGTTFYVYNAYYLDTNTNKSADLSGQYIFRSYHQGIVEADVTSVTNLNSDITRYDRSKFEEIPYIIPSTISDGIQNVSVIKNKFGKNTKNSFYYLGAKNGDYIRLTDITSHLKIVEINTDSDGTEYIVVDRLLNESDLTNIKTKVNLYVSVKDIPQFRDMTSVNTQSVNLGTCLEVVADSIVSCTDYNTQEQCNMRKNNLSDIQTNFVVGGYCNPPETRTALPSQSILSQLTLELSNTVNNMRSTPIIKGAPNTQSSFYGRNF